MNYPGVNVLNVGDWVTHPLSGYGRIERIMPGGVIEVCRYFLPFERGGKAGSGFGWCMQVDSGRIEKKMSPDEIAKHPELGFAYITSRGAVP